MREVVVGAGRAIGSWCGGVCGRDVMVVVNWWVEGSGGGGVLYFEFNWSETRWMVWGEEYPSLL